MHVAGERGTKKLVENEGKWLFDLVVKRSVHRKRMTA
jgi:hypothetical protein